MLARSPKNIALVFDRLYKLGPMHFMVNIVKQEGLHKKMAI